MGHPRGQPSPSLPASLAGEPGPGRSSPAKAPWEPLCSGQGRLALLQLAVQTLDPISSCVEQFRRPQHPPSPASYEVHAQGGTSIHLCPPGKVPGKDSDWSWLGPVPIPAPITVVRSMENGDWPGLGHMLSLVAKGQGQNTGIALAPRKSRLGLRLGLGGEATSPGQGYSSLGHGVGLQGKCRCQMSMLRLSPRWGQAGRDGPGGWGQQEECTGTPPLLPHVQGDGVQGHPLCSPCAAVLVPRASLPCRQSTRCKHLPCRLLGVALLEFPAADRNRSPFYYPQRTSGNTLGSVWPSQWAEELTPRPS